MNDEQDMTVWERVVREQERAGDSSGFAMRHEGVLAAESLSGRAFHEHMASVHRRNERRHLAMADLYCSRALQRALQSVEETRSIRRFSVVADVAAVAHARAAILIMVDTQSFQTLVMASDAGARRVADMEFAFSQGPVCEVLRHRQPVQALGPDVTSRWQDYGRELRALGYAGVAAVPLDLRGVLTGALVLLDPQEHVDGGRLAAKHAGNALVRVFNAVPDAADTGCRQATLRIAEATALRYGGTLDDALAMIRARVITERRSLAPKARTVPRRRAQAAG